METLLKYSKTRIAEIIRKNAAKGLQSWTSIDGELLCSGGTCSECDDRRERFNKTVEFFENPPITLFQAQLIKWHACDGGRVRVGAKTAREWWSTSTNSSDMRWILNILGVFGNATCPEAFYPSWNEPDSTLCSRMRLAYPFETLQALSEGM